MHGAPGVGQDQARARAPPRVPRRATIVSTAFLVGHGDLDGLERERLGDRERLLRDREGDVAGVGPQSRHRSQAGRARHARLPADDENRRPRCTSCRRGAGAESPRGALRSRAARPSARLEADVRDDDATRVEAARARRRARPCGAWNVTVSSAATAAPAISPVEASTPEGRSTATTGAPPRSCARSTRRLPGAARRGIPSRTARRRPRRSRRRRPSRRRRGPLHAVRARPHVHRLRSSRPRRRTRSAELPETRASPRVRPPHPRAPSARGSTPGSSGSAPPPLASRRRCRGAGTDQPSARADDRDRRRDLARVGHREIDRARLERARRTPRSSRSAALPASAGRRSRSPST